MEKALRELILDEDTIAFDCMIKQEDGLSRPPDKKPVETYPSFEFRRGSPPSPSPADVLFANGLLQPHTFPLKSTKTSGTQTESSASSNSTSRSNSTASRSSSGNSRSDGLGQRLSSESVPANSRRTAPKHGPFQVGGSDLRWQHFGPGIPSLVSSTSRRGSRRARTDEVTSEDYRAKNVEKPRGFFGSVMSACQQCHAIEPSKYVDDKPIRA